MLKLYYLGASAAVSPGGKTRNVKIDTFSPGLKGPATLFLTAGMLWRNAMIAATSSFVMLINEG
jgi:hypothetical protein